MTDDLENLRRALDASTPSPNTDAKARNLRLAQENFDRLQGTTIQQRPTSDRRPILARLNSGVARMFQSLTSRGGLAATTALVAVGLFVLTPQGRSLLTPPPVIPVGDEVFVTDGAEIANAEFGALNKLVDRNRSNDVDTLAIPDLKAAREQEESSIAAAPVLERALAQDAMSKSEPSVSAAIASMPTVSRGYVAETDVYRVPDENTETFANEDPNPLKVTIQDPVSTFSIDVDTASYAVVRSSLTAGMMPPPAAVRIEEMINYFPYDYPGPSLGEAPFRPTVSAMQTPWNADTRLIHIAFQGRMPDIDDRPPLNLVFLIDTSGSMQSPDKLPLLKQSFRLMLGQLRPTDQVAIVTYAGSAGQVLEPTDAAERSTILRALDQLQAGGSTAGQAGLQQAYSVAESMAQDGEVTRVILATDGDFNVGLSDPEALKDYIADKRNSGTYLSVLGFGRGNLDDATMQALAQNGNGQAAYIDTLNEAQKVLVDQLTGTLFPIAGDVKVQVEFNPATVAEYRLIGYETRALAREDFNNDQVDAGEIGAGHSVTAIYEITPVGSPAVLNTPLRYQPEESAHGAASEFGFLRLRYKEPGESVSKLIETPIPIEAASASLDARFSAAIAGFGQLLRGSDYLGDWSWDDAISLARSNLGEDAFGYRREAVSLMRLAQSLDRN